MIWFRLELRLQGAKISFLVKIHHEQETPSNKKHLRYAWMAQI